MSHAQLSPSSAVRWMTCPGSLALCKDLPDDTNKFAAEGTMMHTVAEECLGAAGINAAMYVGQTFSRDGFDCVFTADHVAPVQQYVDYVNDLVASTGGQLLVEQRLPIGHLTNEIGARGTCDALILAGDTLYVIDLKGGMGVRVDAEDNPQLSIYALAAVEEFSLAHDFVNVTMVIHQPRLSHVSEHTISVTDLKAFGDDVVVAAAATRLAVAPLVPSTKGCKFCKAKATCPALRQEVLDTFDNVAPQAASDDELGQAMAKVDLIDGWVKAIRAETERRLLAGVAVEGWKLIQGKRGNRSWIDAEHAEATLKSMKLTVNEMYDFKLISPTTLGKRLDVWVDEGGVTQKPVCGPRQKLLALALIHQKDGSPTVAPFNDKRPALNMSADADFSVL
jgi:hypothetical protein